VIAIGAGILIVALIGFAILYSFESAGNRGVKGEIIEKIFVAAPETQISISTSKGLSRKEIAGEYSFKVKDSINGTVYTLSVSKNVFDSYEKGQNFIFDRKQ